MIKDYETRHIFMAIAICIAVISPVLILVLPTFIANTLYHTPDNWYIFVAGKTYGVYSIGFLFLTLSPFALFLLAGRKFSVLISIAFLLLSGLTFYVASLNYTSLATNSISYREMFTTENHTYSWSEIDRVIFNRMHEEDGFSEYEFHFNDGNEMTLVENSIVSGLRDSIVNRLNAEDIAIE
jgi:ABC-type transport system involved in multi-copper enzyme maturation permease subunit